MHLFSPLNISCWVNNYSLLLFSHKVVYYSLQTHGLQHASLPCPSPSPGISSNSYPLSWWFCVEALADADSACGIASTQDSCSREGRADFLRRLSWLPPKGVSQPFMAVSKVTASIRSMSGAGSPGRTGLREPVRMLIPLLTLHFHTSLRQNPGPLPLPRCPFAFTCPCWGKWLCIVCPFHPCPAPRRLLSWSQKARLSLSMKLCGERFQPIQLYFKKWGRNFETNPRFPGAQCEWVRESHWSSRGGPGPSLGLSLGPVASTHFQPSPGGFLGTSRGPRIWKLAGAGWADG